MADQRFDGPIYDQAIASATLTGHRAVIIKNDAVSYANSNDLTHKGFVAGILQASVISGNAAAVQTYGVIFDDTWTWDTALPDIWFDEMGILTQTKPSNQAFLQVVARVINATTLFVSLGDPYEPPTNHRHIREEFTLGGSDIENEYILLGQTPRLPETVKLFVQKNGNVKAGRDFQMDGSNVKKLRWDDLALATSLVVGDVFEVRYERES